MRYTPVYLLCIFCGVMLSGCGVRQEESPTAVRVDSSGTAVFVLKADTLHKPLVLPGELIPFQQTVLYPKVQGYIRSMSVDIGDRVRKGELLIRIEAPELNTEAAKNEASLSAARSRFLASADRYHRLRRASLSNAAGIVAPADLEGSLRQMENDSSALEALRQQSLSSRQVAGYLEIRAPFDGIITERKIDPGALVNPNTAMLTIQDNHLLRIRLAVPEIYTAAAHTPGLTFNIDAYPQMEFKATLSRTTGAIDPRTRTEIWEFLFDNGERRLKAGAYLTGHLGIKRDHPSFIVPSAAVVTSAERRFVIKAEGGFTRWVDVRSGISGNGGIEVFGDLKDGDTLLSRPTEEKKPGLPIHAKIPYGIN